MTTAIPFKFMVSGTTPELRRIYRAWRRIGFQRYDANILIIGMMMGMKIGKIEVRIYHDDS